MPENGLAGAAALVTGTSRGFGRGIATALTGAGAHVVGVARGRGPLDELRAGLGESFTAVSADAADPVVASQLIDAYRPAILVLNVGATPLPRPIQHHTWQTFGRNWDIDVAHVFPWTREALLAPLEPASTVITLSSGAALRGSPLSGGYAGAKAAIRWLTAYAAGESQRAELGIRFVSVLPQLTPATRWARCSSPLTPPGRAQTPPPAPAARRSPPSRQARRSSISPATPPTRMPTCSPLRAFARCPDPADQP
jgi:NAD(P)-dependent dehydrogenase (short-subunit alcohol dehydrogenase family)